MGKIICSYLLLEHRIELANERTLTVENARTGNGENNTPPQRRRRMMSLACHSEEKEEGLSHCEETEKGLSHGEKKIIKKIIGFH
jgi:hypothetical protein